MNENFTLNEQVQIKLADLVYGNLKYGQLAEFLAFSIAVAVLWGRDNTILLIWYVISILFCALRYLTTIGYQRKQLQHSPDLKKWLILLNISAFIAGASWGPLGSLLIPNFLSTNQLFVILILLGATCAANLFYSPIKYLYIFFIIPAYIPHIFWLFSQGEGYYSIGIVAIIYLGLMLILSMGICKLLTESIKLQFENVELRNTLYQQAIHDPLTGLFNRRYLEEILNRELIRIDRDKSTLIVALLDLDHFKRINDNYGHDAGDEVLRYVGQLMSKFFRKSDIVFRYGGEEFIVILFNISLKRATTLLNDFREGLKKERISFENLNLPEITISIGVAEAPQYGTSSQKIINAADKALYNAKNMGRDQLQIYQGNENLNKLD